MRAVRAAQRTAHDTVTFSTTPLRRRVDMPISIVSAAGTVKAALVRASKQRHPSRDPPVVAKRCRVTEVSRLSQGKRYGGSTRAPKFPMPYPGTYQPQHQGRPRPRAKYPGRGGPASSAEKKRPKSSRSPKKKRGVATSPITTSGGREIKSLSKVATVAGSGVKRESRKRPRSAHGALSRGFTHDRTRSEVSPMSSRTVVASSGADIGKQRGHLKSSSPSRKPHARDGGAAWVKEPGGRKKKQATRPASAPSRHSPNNVDAGALTALSRMADGSYNSPGELRIMKWIVLRETYLDKLHGVVLASQKRAKQSSKYGVPTRHRSEKQATKLFSLLVELLTVLRRITVEIVEAIERWRGPGSNKSFAWGQSNYLVKAAGDAAFLADLPGLEQHLGISLANNPFVCHVRLDGKPAYLHFGNEEGRRGGGKGAIGQRSQGTLRAVVASESLGVSPERVEAAAAVLYREVQLAGGARISSRTAGRSDSKRREEKNDAEMASPQYRRQESHHSDETGRGSKDIPLRTGQESRMSLSHMRRESNRSTVAANDPESTAGVEDGADVCENKEYYLHDYQDYQGYEGYEGYEGYRQGYQDDYNRDIDPNATEPAATAQENVDGAYGTAGDNLYQNGYGEERWEDVPVEPAVESPAEMSGVVETTTYPPEDMLVDQNAPAEEMPAQAQDAGEPEKEALEANTPEDHVAPEGETGEGQEDLDIGAAEIATDANDIAMDREDLQGPQREWVRRGSPFIAIHSMCDGLLNELQANGLGAAGDEGCAYDDDILQSGAAEYPNVDAGEDIRTSWDIQHEESPEQKPILLKNEPQGHGQRRSTVGRNTKGLGILANFQGNKRQRPHRLGSHQEQSEDDEDDNGDGDDVVDANGNPIHRPHRRKKKTLYAIKRKAFTAWAGRTEARQNYRDAKADRQHNRRRLKRAMSAWESYRHKILGRRMAKAFCGQFGLSDRFYLRTTFTALRVHARGAHIAARHRSTLAAASDRLEIVGRVRMRQAWRRWSAIVTGGDWEEPALRHDANFEPDANQPPEEEDSMARWLMSDGDDERSTHAPMKVSREEKTIDAPGIVVRSVSSGLRPTNSPSQRVGLGTKMKSVASSPALHPTNSPAERVGLGAKMKSLASFRSFTSKSKTSSFRKASGLITQSLGARRIEGPVASTAAGNDVGRCQPMAADQNRSSPISSITPAAAEFERELQIKRERDLEYAKTTAAATCIQHSWCAARERPVVRRINFSASLIQRAWRLKEARRRAAGRVARAWRNRASVRSKILNQALMEAAGAGDLRAVSFLLREKTIAAGVLHVPKADACAEISAPESPGGMTTPLHAASREGSGLPNQLWSHTTGETRSMTIVDSRKSAGIVRGGGDADWAGVIKALVEAGAALESGDGEGLTPMMAAADGGGKDAVSALAAVGAEVDAAERSGCGRTPLVIAAQRANARAASALLEYGARVNRTIEDGATPLHEASGAGSTEVAEMLVRAGAKVDAQTESAGMTPLHLAIANDQHGAVRLLVHSGADVSLADNRGLTPLRLAVEMGDKATVELVLAADPPAEVDIEDKNGSTELHAACRQGYAEIAKLLLEANADPHVRDKEGRTPELVALDFDNGDCAALFYNLAIVPNISRKSRANERKSVHAEPSEVVEPDSGSDGERCGRASSTDDSVIELPVGRQKVSWAKSDPESPSTGRSHTTRSSSSASVSESGVSPSDDGSRHSRSSGPSSGSGGGGGDTSEGEDHIAAMGMNGYLDAAEHHQETETGGGGWEGEEWPSAAVPDPGETAGVAPVEAGGDATQYTDQWYGYGSCEGGSNELHPSDGDDDGVGVDVGASPGGYDEGWTWSATDGWQVSNSERPPVIEEATDQAPWGEAAEQTFPEGHWNEHPETGYDEQRKQYTNSNASARLSYSETETRYDGADTNGEWRASGESHEMGCVNHDESYAVTQEASETWPSAQAWDAHQGQGGQYGEGEQGEATPFTGYDDTGTNVQSAATAVGSSDSKRESYDAYDDANFNEITTHDASDSVQLNIQPSVPGEGVTPPEPEVEDTAEEATATTERVGWKVAVECAKVANRWTAMVDQDSGHTYYLDEKSGETRWEVPGSEEETDASTAGHLEKHDDSVPREGAGGEASSESSPADT